MLTAYTYACMLSAYTYARMLFLEQRQAAKCFRILKKKFSERS